MPIDIKTPSTANGSMYSRRRVAVSRYLVDQGATPGAVPLHNLDLSGVTEVAGGFTVPDDFTAQVRAAFPAAFGGAAFDAMTATAAEVDAALKELQRTNARHKADARTAAALANGGAGAAFDAMTASAADVDRELAALTGRR